jgi:hypothetical protein
MKTLIRLEEFAMLVLALYLFSLLNYPWWLFAVLFLTPDIGMLGYVVNTKTGAVTYNIFHHKGIAIALYLVGIFLNKPLFMFVGLLLFAHSSFDRIFGYGLKFSDNFKHTHLGLIGNKP